MKTPDWNDEDAVQTWLAWKIVEWSLKGLIFLLFGIVLLWKHASPKGRQLMLFTAGILAGVLLLALVMNSLANRSVNPWNNPVVPQQVSVTNCSGIPSRVYPGGTAMVSDVDPYPLKVYRNPGRNSGLKFKVPIRKLVTIISGAVCKDNTIWVEVGYNGQSGWTEEATKGMYNLIPE